MNKADIDNAMRKIRNCMDLSTSSNEHEAAMALKQMKALMKKYDISSSDVKLSSISEKEIELNVKKRVPKWTIDLFVTVTQALDCECIINRFHSNHNAQIVILGESSSIEIAAYAIDVLLKKLIKARKSYIETSLKRYGRSNKTKLADAYCSAWVGQVYSKCKNLNPNKEIEELIKEYQEVKIGEIGEDKTQDRFNKKDKSVREAMFKGYEDANDVQLYAATGFTSPKLIS